jgi:hypothetical protein
VRIFVITSAIALAAPTAAGSSFEHEVIDPDPPSGDGCCLDILATGDINGDGAEDVVIGSQFSDGVSWYQNPGGDEPEGPWPRFPIAPGEFTTDGKTADLDADGDVDVLMSSVEPARVEWWEQTGDPTSIAGWARHDIGPDVAHDLVVGPSVYLNLDGSGGDWREVHLADWSDQARSAIG